MNYISRKSFIFALDDYDPSIIIIIFFHCINLCFTFFQNDSVRVCEHCLKITRAPTAYEECCTDKDNAFSWCQRIYNFSQSKGRR